MGFQYKNNDVDTGNGATHTIKIMTNQLIKECERAKVPVFVAYHVRDAKGRGKYQYNAVLPEEVGVNSEYGKFQEFLKTCLGFNKEDYLSPEIRENEK